MRDFKTNIAGIMRDHQESLMEEAVARFTNEEYATLRAKLATAEAQRDALAEALELLYSVQNGCPLPSYEADYAEAIRKTEAALRGAGKGEL